MNTVRNMWDYTGTYNGKRVSVMAHGMGIPSVSIYATELIRDYGVEETSCAWAHAVRWGRRFNWAIFLSPWVHPRTASAIACRLMDHDFAAIADYLLLSAAVSVAQKQAARRVHVGNVFSADLIHTAAGAVRQTGKMNVLAVEMESAGLYGLAAGTGARALTLLTVSDQIRTHQHLSAEARQTSFGSMIEMALETAGAAVVFQARRVKTPYLARCSSLLCSKRRASASASVWHFVAMRSILTHPSHSMGICTRLPRTVRSNHACCLRRWRPQSFRVRRDRLASDPQISTPTIQRPLAFRQYDCRKRN